ncbi:MAG: precorrin-2 C(20)-methyltransferase [Nitrososphaerales archaeon]
MTGKVIGIGIGPGDPELITIKALKVLKTADVICVPKAHMEKPSIALSMVKHILEEREKYPEVIELIFPMMKDEFELKRLLDRNAKIVAEKAKKCNTLAFITLGDPFFYSTFIYLYHNLKEMYPEIELEIIPGITSLTACSASSRIPLAEKNETVIIIPSNISSNQIEEIAKYADNLVFMKGTKNIKDLVPILERVGFTKNSTIIFAKRCTMPEEKVIIGKLSDVKNWDIYEDYFSMVIIKRSKFQSNKNRDE